MRWRGNLILKIRLKTAVLRFNAQLELKNPATAGFFVFSTSNLIFYIRLTTWFQTWPPSCPDDRSCSHRRLRSLTISFLPCRPVRSANCFKDSPADKLRSGMKLLITADYPKNDKVYSQQHMSIDEYTMVMGTVVTAVRKSVKDVKLFAPHTLPNNIIVWFRLRMVDKN